MVLQNKYNELVTAATNSAVANLQVREQEGILYIDGEAPTGAVKDMLWSVYDKIDPNFLSGDLVMNINVIATAPVTKAKVTTERSNLNIRKGPGTDQPIVGKAAHHEIVTVVSQSSEQWWLIRTVDNEEGYAYAQYLTPELES
ncbi:MAG: SH3 domain-containing protein [Chitinophagaceae bacterium]|nr:SH3 domain-containing protein [Chitinophagaceae bacterium]MBK8605532.1 SH3 domain-containing protein [Chitinophagaceae bacterium]MBP6477063.1 SH3 domain-containing protein [Chitinophagaceae bacterium]MBP7108711.1 SH3 domain-containing protein [Chitinophagaceae bacterium]MBP7314323.1 SH3 domain-containing protein [Chitinophagaceae bacterium]